MPPKTSSRANSPQYQIITRRSIHFASQDKPSRSTSLLTLHPRAKTLWHTDTSLGLLGAPGCLEQVNYLTSLRLSDMRQAPRARLNTGGHKPSWAPTVYTHSGMQIENSIFVSARERRSLLYMIARPFEIQAYFAYCLTVKMLDVLPTKYGFILIKICPIERRCKICQNMTKSKNRHFYSSTETA